MRQQRPMPSANTTEAYERENLEREDERGGVQTLPAPPRPPAARPQRPEQVDETDLIQIDPFADGSLARQANGGEELEGMEELGQQLNWVSLDAQKGVLVCKNLNLEVGEFVGLIIESRVVRVMKEPDGSGAVFCASSNREVADVGRPGRECGPCEDKGNGCFPRWWIAWQEEDSGLVFAHTLSQTGTLNFTRYVNSLQREGLKPSQIPTRLFVEEARRQKTGTAYRRLQFEKSDPFA